MARTIPAPPVSVPSDANFGTGVDIQAGSGALPGRLFDVVKLANLAYSTVCADCVWAQTWADGQATQGNTAGAYVSQTKLRILPISSQHTTLKCSVYASSASGTGVIRFRGINAGTAANTGAIAAVAAWYHVTLSVAGGFGPGYEDVAMDWQDDVVVSSVRVIYEQHDPSGLWPGADGALGTAALEGSTVWALDTAETAADVPYSAALLQRIRAIVSHVQARPRPVAAACVPENTSPALTWPSVAAWPHRVAYLSDDVRTLRVYGRGVQNVARPTGDPVYLHVQVAAMDPLAVQRDAAQIGYGRVAVVDSFNRLGGDTAGTGSVRLLADAWENGEFLATGRPLTAYVDPPHPVAGVLTWLAAYMQPLQTGPLTYASAYAVSVWEV